MFICFFFHLRTNLLVCKVLCGCAIILTRVILFSSICVNVDILSAFHVSTSTPIVVVVVTVVMYMFFSLLIFVRLDSPLPFVIMQRFHLQKLIQQTGSLLLFQRTNEHQMEWKGNWYTNFQVSAEKVIIFAPIYILARPFSTISPILSLYPTTMCCSLERLYLIMSSSFVQQFIQRQMRLLRWLLKNHGKNYKNICCRLIVLHKPLKFIKNRVPPSIHPSISVLYEVCL